MKYFIKSIKNCAFAFFIIVLITNPPPLLEVREQRQEEVDFDCYQNLYNGSTIASGKSSRVNP